MKKIEWLTDGNTEMPKIDTARLEEWIAAVARTHNRIIGPLTYIFCDDPKIIEVNRQFLNHDYFTDIITFDYSRGRMISGDMFISLDTVLSNSEMVGAPYERRASPCNHPRCPASLRNQRQGPRRARNNGII